MFLMQQTAIKNPTEITAPTVAINAVSIGFCFTNVTTLSASFFIHSGMLTPPETKETSFLFNPIIELNADA